MIRNAIFLTLVAFALTFTPASAALVDLSQHGYGPGLIYDSNSQLVWLQDANYARTSGYDTDGKMTWSAAGTWVDGLDVFGYSDWRLPQFASAGWGETNSEFSSLNTQLADPANRGLFDNLMIDASYWSETQPFSTFARAFHFGSGRPSSLPIGSDGYAWAVRDADGISLTHTPVPASLWLMASGIFCLLGYRRKRS